MCGIDVGIFTSNVICLLLMESICFGLQFICLEIMALMIKKPTVLPGFSPSTVAVTNLLLINKFNGY